MPSLKSNKKMDKPTKARIIIVTIIIIIDIIFLPWILKLPFFLFEDMLKGPGMWLDFGIINSFKAAFFEHDFRKLYLFMQLPVATLILGIVWNVDRLKRKNKISDGVGGPEPSGAGQHGTSRWQNKQEMDKTATVWDTDDPIKKSGIIFGMEKSKSGKEKVWLNDDDVHNLIIGATRSGKSRKIILPSIWTLAKAEESMIIGDPKGELYISSKEYLEEQGYNVIALNLREPLKGNRWNMLDLAVKAKSDEDLPRAIECAWDIATTIINKQNASSTEPIWINGSQSVIASLILATIMDSDFEFQKHMPSVYYLLSELGAPLEDGSVPLNDFMDSLPKRHPAKDAFATAKIAAQKTRSSFFTSVLTELRLFTDPTLQDMTSKQDHIIENIGIEKTAVFLIVPDEKSTRNVLATLYVDQVYQSMVELANKRGGRIPRRVNIILDEFGNLPPIPDFDKKLTVAGGRGIRFTIALQDIAQLKKLYDKNAQTITGNCHNWIYLKTADVETAKLISEKTGKYTVETENASSSVQSKGHSRTHGAGLAGRPLLFPDEVLRWNIDEGLLLPISYFPARYPLPDLTMWKANEEFGFVKPSGNLDSDKEKNRQIIEKRWQNIYKRKIEEISIWLPDLEDEEENEEDAIDETYKTVSLIKKADEEQIEEKAKKEQEDIKEVQVEDYSLDNILKIATTKENEDEDEDEDEGSEEDEEDFL